MRDHGDETRELDPVQAELLHCNLLDSLAADLVAYEGENERVCNEFLALSQRDREYVGMMMKCLPVLRSQKVVF